ncbi:MAG: carbamoyl phosphate synthase small subunit [Acutalibacteraceae bacterium]|jgi:carbamoyl-phosphate synthase small subunit
MKALLMLEDGTKYEGTGIGECRNVVCEVVFNTGMCGYPELLTDPSYCGQAVVMTYPLVGNYGVCYDDAESSRPWVGAYIVHSLTLHGSNFRRDMDLDRYLLANHIPGMEGLDTRALTRHLRERGTMRGAISYGDSINEAEMLRAARSYRLTSHVPLVSRADNRFYPGEGAKVAMIDFGVKQSIITSLTKRGCSVQCFPYDVDFETIRQYAPDGVMLTNGPDDPQDCVHAIGEIRKLLDYGIPTFAICLGHQLMALATGAQTERLKYGHRGVNHPVKELAANRVYITSQNHGYVVKGETVDPKIAEISFVSMNDGSVEGLNYQNGRAFSVQFHPEAAPGPKDTAFLFDRFVSLMGGARK